MKEKPPFRFSAQTRVGFSDTDAQGIVYYGRYLPYFDLAQDVVGVTAAVQDPVDCLERARVRAHVSSASPSNARIAFL